MKFSFGFCSFAIFFLSMLCSPTVAKAQTFGWKGGLVASSINGQHQMDNVQPGVQVGGFATLGGENIIFFKSELLFTHKGVRNWRGIEGVSGLRLSLIYADLPLMFGIKASDRITITLGFQPSLLIYGHNSYEQMGERINESKTNDLRTMDYATVMGLEYTLHDRIFIGGRYCHGFVPIQKREGEFDMDGVPPTLMTIQLYVGFNLN